MRSRPFTDLLKQHIPYRFTPEMKRIMRDFMRESPEPYVLAYPYWDAAIDGSRPSRLYCDTYRSGFEGRSYSSSLIIRSILLSS